jgi:hypothetical protein
MNSLKSIRCSTFYQHDDAFNDGYRHRQKIIASYTRQYDAYRAYDELSVFNRARCKVFSYVAPSSGKRQFLLADMSSFVVLLPKIGSNDY